MSMEQQRDWQSDQWGDGESIHQASEPIREDAPRPVDAPLERGSEQTIKLTTHTLGLEPYVLIRAVPDGDDIRIKVDHNDVEGGSGASIALLYVLNLPAEQNPLTAAIKAVIDANPDDQAIVEGLHLFAEFCDIPMPESGR